MKVRQLPLERLEIAEGEAKTRRLAQVVSPGELHLPRFEKLAKILTPPPLYDMARVGSECLHCMDRILSADLAIRTPAVAR